MHRYDSRGSLATRDIVARAIFREMKTADKDHLWLDLRHLNAREFQLKFPSIATRLQAMEIDIQKDLVPILPAAHYFCGGVVTDQWAQTSVYRLLACGECARTGLHGANRLASNSLLEALVFARQGFLKLKENFQETRFTQQHLIEAREQESIPDLSELRKKLQYTMTRHAGIIRSRKGLKNARHEVEEMLRSLPKTHDSIPGRELRNMLIVALAVIEDSLQQEENRGGFFRQDLEKSAPHLVT